MLELKRLSFSYANHPFLFKELDLSLNEVNIYGLLGKNGAGKTTLLKIISGLLFPDKGNCKVLGFEPCKRDVRFLQDIYFLAEEFYTPRVSIETYIKYYSCLYPKFSKEAFLEYLLQFSVPTKSNLSSLSYGQKKKFFLAFGLATNAKLVLLDEPTNGLDIPTKSIFRKLLTEALGLGRIIIISTHQVRDLENLLDHVIILDAGKIIFNENMFKVSQRLKVIETPEVADKQSILFSEKILSGYSAITENFDSNLQGKMNLELLFNAVIAEPRKIETIFNKEETHGNA